MFKIGDFSRFSRVSIKMLRHYDEIDLLKPAHVDTFTRYRYYTADQLPRLNRIIALKELGFSLEQIATLLDDDLNAGEIRGLLKLKRAEIEQRLREEQARLAQVEARIQQIELEDGIPPYDVVLRQIPAQKVATMREVVQVNTRRISHMFETVEAFVARHTAREISPPLMIYHDAEYREDHIDVEVAIPINKTIPQNDDVNILMLSAVPEMACVVHTGDYDSMSKALNVLFNWIDTHDYDVAGATREVYLRFGANNEGYILPDAYLANHADEFVTELQIPIEKRA